MIRRPPRSTLFPYTTSSDLHPRPRDERPFLEREVLVGDQPVRVDFEAAAEPGADRARTVGRVEAERSRLELLRSEEPPSELQSPQYLVCSLLLETKQRTSAT